MPKLSVIVPVYNTEKYLRECIDSILAQNFRDFELLLVDDGSTDGSGAICDEYADKDPRVQVIHQKNGGVTRARKAAMQIAKGGWISFVDADDWLDPEMYDKMLTEADNHAAEVVVCDAVLEFPNQGEIAGNLSAEGFYDKAAMAQKIYPTMLMHFDRRQPGMAGWLCNKLFAKPLLDRVFWSVDDTVVFSEDALCCYAAILECQRIYICRSPWYHYRQHPNSVMHQYNGAKRYQHLLRAYDAHRDVLTMHGPAYLPQLQDFIAVNTISNLRKVLLFNAETPLPTRLSQGKAFVSAQIVVDALRETRSKHHSRKDRLKAFLALHKWIGPLYLLFLLKEYKLRPTR